MNKNPAEFRTQDRSLSNLQGFGDTSSKDWTAINSIRLENCPSSKESRYSTFSAGYDWTTSKTTNALRQLMIQNSHLPLHFTCFSPAFWIPIPPCKNRTHPHNPSFIIHQSWVTSIMNIINHRRRHHRRRHHHHHHHHSVSIHMVFLQSHHVSSSSDSPQWVSTVPVPAAHVAPWLSSRAARSPPWVDSI